MRIGVNTGEVVTGTEERLATGDAVNVAARLEQAAQPDDILIGSETLQLLGDAVTVELVERLELKGKAEPLDAYRLISVRATTGAVAARRRTHGRPNAAAEDAPRRLRQRRQRALVPLVHRARIGGRGKDTSRVGVPALPR